MTAQPPDPDVTQTPDLEPGGGVRAGATPPAAPQTSGVSEPQAEARHRYTATQIVTFVAVALFVIAFAASAVGMILHMMG